MPPRCPHSTAYPYLPRISLRYFRGVIPTPEGGPAPLADATVGTTCGWLHVHYCYPVKA